uniref:Permuted papain-like amidase YaeF/Yiix C92 family enzyme n=1 Tax=Panagrolaimus sp. ES5 TaxID=591445 RepID=A0AC34GX45_9BILA
MSKNEAKIIPGDLFFFQKKLPSSGDAYEKVNPKTIDDTEAEYYHVGIFLNEKTIIHVVRGKGVILQPFWEAVLITKPSKIEICRVKCSAEQRQTAVKFAYSEIGVAYNDLMSPNFVNSKHQKAYSCTQLICEAFSRSNIIFEQEPMNFKNKNGEFYGFFAKQFSALNLPIPQGQLGTYPSQFRRSKNLVMFKCFERDGDIIAENEVVAKEHYKNVEIISASKM